MEKKEEIKKEKISGSLLYSDSIFSSSSYGQQMISSLFDQFNEGDEKMSSLGFMELLGVDDFRPNSHFGLSQSLTLPLSASIPSVSVKECSSEVLNQPPTPNSSISSASSGGGDGAVNCDEMGKDLDQDDEDLQQPKKQMKAGKKANQKRQREPRFAFMTKSEVDHLEDGYRWRKYGQKAVKNSSFPRSYYRCTSASCNVKKRVERSFADPTIVVTTYEGQHTHPSPVMPRQSFMASPPSSAAFSVACAANYSNMPKPTTTSIPSHYQHYVNSYSPSLNFSQLQGQGFHLADHGLLQDVIPSHMLKQE